MPTNYHCEACQLSFALGWYHFHDAHRVKGKIYWSACDLVCKVCGTWHQILFKNDLKSVAKDYPDILRSLKAPLTQEEETYFSRKRPLNWFYRQDWTNTSDVICGYCRAVGTLANESDYRNQEREEFSKTRLTCPRCHQQSLRILSVWMT